MSYAKSAVIQRAYEIREMAVSGPELKLNPTGDVKKKLIKKNKIL